MSVGWALSFRRPLRRGDRRAARSSRDLLRGGERRRASQRDRGGATSCWAGSRRPRTPRRAVPCFGVPVDGHALLAAWRSRRGPRGVLAGAAGPARSRPRRRAADDSLQLRVRAGASSAAATTRSSHLARARRHASTAAPCFFAVDPSLGALRGAPWLRAAAQADWGAPSAHGFSTAYSVDDNRHRRRPRAPPGARPIPAAARPRSASPATNRSAATTASTPGSRRRTRRCARRCRRRPGRPRRARARSISRQPSRNRSRMTGRPRPDRSAAAQRP